MSVPSRCTRYGVCREQQPWHTHRVECPSMGGALDGVEGAALVTYTTESFLACSFQYSTVRGVKVKRPNRGASRRVKG